MSPLAREDILGLVALTEERITDAIDSLGLDEPEAAALVLAKALSAVRALRGKIERETTEEQAEVAS